MQPYGRTYRASKIHKAKDCGICEEDVSGGGNYQRQLSKQAITKEIEDYEELTTITGKAEIYWHKGVGEWVVMVDGKFIGYLQP